MVEGITWVGLDVHKKSIHAAVLFPGEKPPVDWQLVNDVRSVKRMVRKIGKGAAGQEIRACYEAGPCGYALQKQMLNLGVVCEVVAPSLIPKKPGEHVKTDRRDAIKLAELLRAGLLTEVIPPSEQDEALRDLCRAREDAKQDLLRARHRLSKFMLRRGHIYSAGKNWSARHWQWLRSLKFDHEATQVTVDDYMLAVDQIKTRIASLELRLAEQAGNERYATAVGALCCFRGIAMITAITIVAELHDFFRFKDPRQLMSYLGLIPSEHSSGESSRRGGITKAGNAHARRVMVEAAWHYRHKPAVGLTLRQRRVGQPGEVIAIADKAQQRLNQRYRHLIGKGKTPQVAITAIARELVGFVWAAMQALAKEPVDNAA